MYSKCLAPRRLRAPVAISSVLIPLLGLLQPTYAGPLILEESARITSPDPTYTLNGSVGAWGNGIVPDAIVAAATKVLPSGVRVHAAFLFERPIGTANWIFTRKLVEQADTSNTGMPITVAMNEKTAAVNLPTPNGSSLHVFRLEAAPASQRPRWLEEPVSGSVMTKDIEVSGSGNLIAAGRGVCSWDARVFQRENTGRWVISGDVTGATRDCNNDHLGGDVDISQSMIVGNPENQDEPPQIRFYSTPAFPGDTIYLQAARLNGDEPLMETGKAVAILGELAATAGTYRGGTALFRDQYIYQTMQPIDIFQAGRPVFIDIKDGLVIQQHNQPNGAVAVFKQVPGALAIYDYPYVAKLVPSVGRFSNKRAQIGNATFAVVQGEGAAYVYDLPEDYTQPLRREDDFQDGDAVGWNPQLGGSFSVVNTANGRVYRQQSVSGNATSLLSDSVMKNQSVQADLRPIAFNGADRWLGLAVRYTDVNNYYYVTLRSSNVVQLRRIVNGQFTTLASAPLAVTPGREYNVRLEAIGGTLRVYIDTAEVLKARDASHQQGSAGLIMYKTRADYDNVIVSPNSRAPIFADDFENSNDGNERWIPQTTTWNVISNSGSHVYEQSSAEGGTLSWAGMSNTEDQIIETRVKATAFGSGAGRWFGVMARYQYLTDYYYVTVRNDNTVSLRKLVNNVIYVLDTAPLTVTANTWYKLRFEVIGSSLRAYVNDRLLLEAKDTQFPMGQYGVVTYKAAALYDDFKVVQP